MSLVVSNSSPLIALARIQRLDLVPTILQSALIPPAVAREIAPSIPVLPHWLEVRAPTSSVSVLTSRGRLGDGEWEAIALGVELGAGAILIDDRPAKTSWLSRMRRRHASTIRASCGLEVRSVSKSAFDSSIARRATATTASDCSNELPETGAECGETTL